MLLESNLNQDNSRNSTISNPLTHYVCPLLKNESFKQTFSAFNGGLAQTLIGQPLDLCKVLIQTGQFKSPIAAARSVVKNEGVLGLYKGSLVPLLGVGVINAIMFNFCFEARRLILKHSETGALTLSQIYLSGTIAGGLTSFINTPVEGIRILLQAQPHGIKLFNGPSHCIAQIWKQAGLSGLFRGLGLTFARDTHAHGVWFLTYEYLIERSCGLRKCKREDIPLWELLVYGAIAGDLLWLSVYPIDVVKTIRQNDQFGLQAKFHNTKEVVMYVYKTSGWKGFWSGLTSSLLRAAPVNAGVFCTVELCLRNLG